MHGATASSACMQDAEPPSPTEAVSWATSVRGVRELLPLSDHELEWCPTPRKLSAQGPSAEESGTDDDVSSGPPSWASSLVGAGSPSPCKV